MHDFEIIGYDKYTTVQGDTFDRIALDAYDNEMLASVIIEANPDYTDVLIFDAGVLLYIPIINSSGAPETLPPWRRDL